MQKPLKRIATGLALLSFLILISSCSATKKAQRKARRADKLLKEAGMLAPSIMDTVFITKIDTIVLKKDSIVTKVKLRMDTAKVDSLIEKYAELKSKGLSTKVIEKEVFREIVPDLTYNNTDSLKFTIDGKDQYLRFNVDIKIREDELVVITKPTGDITYVSEMQEINIDARKQGRWWKGFQWGAGIMFLIILAVYIFKDVLIQVLKRYIP